MRWSGTGGRALLVALAGIGATGCDIFGPSGSGVIEVTVVSPYGPEGAAVLELTGGVGLGPVVSDVGDAYAEHVGEVTRVVLLLHEPGTILFTVRSEDVGELPSVRVEQVADGDNQLRASLADYAIEFRQLEDFTSERQWRAP